MFLLLINGGAGFICDDTSLEMHQARRLEVLEDCSNNHPISLERIFEHAGSKVHLD